MKRSGRIAIILKTLSDSPSKIFSLKHFCQLLNAAKSTISEDISMVKEFVESMDMGHIRTIPGTGGGVQFLPYATDEQCKDVQSELCQLINDPSRILGGGFLYTSDIMFDPSIAKKIAPIFARKFKNTHADYVVTIETKGIPIALMTAHYLNLPTIVVRRETKISEGPTVSINYFSGSSDRIQKMSMAKKAVRPGTKALIIDDFMRAGGSLKGIVELLGEFDVQVCGIGVVIASTQPERKKINDYTPLIYLEDVDEQQHTIQLSPNSLIFQKITCQ